MSEEKTAFPTMEYNIAIGDHVLTSRGITYRQYLAARVYPEIIQLSMYPLYADNEGIQNVTMGFKRAAELTWQAVDALIEAEPEPLVAETVNRCAMNRIIHDYLSEAVDDEGMYNKTNILEWCKEHEGKYRNED